MFELPDDRACVWWHWCLWKSLDCAFESAKVALELGSAFVVNNAESLWIEQYGSVERPVDANVIGHCRQRRVCVEPSMGRYEGFTLHARTGRKFGIPLAT